jgi:hypothetical protein
VTDEYSIAVVTEQMPDGTWAVVASIKHLSPNGEKVTDLPVSTARFSSQPEAEAAGVQQGRDWIDRNVPRAA